jgi:hypothetical protein
MLFSSSLLKSQNPKEYTPVVAGELQYARGGGSKKGKSSRVYTGPTEYGYLTKKLTKTSKNLYEKQDSKTKIKNGTFFTRE